MNSIVYNGQKVNIGPTPFFVTAAGFSGPDEVRLVASRHSKGTPVMLGMDDVVAYFKKNVRQD